MKAKITTETFHPETGAAMNTLGPHVTIVDDEHNLVLAELDALLGTFADHYRDTPSERRPVVQFRIEFFEPALEAPRDDDKRGTDDRGMPLDPSHPWNRE